MALVQKKGRITQTKRGDKMTDIVETKVVKPGYKTTEFLLATAAQALGFIVGLGVIPSDSIWEKGIAFAVAGLATLGYSVSRGLTKK